MKKLLLFICTTLLASAGFGQKYIFYLHGKIVESQGPHAIDKVNGYGAYQYYDILDSLRKPGNTVISEVRPENTDVKMYAMKVKMQVDSLIKIGIPANKITVIGASKGSLIAMYASSFIKNKSVNFVLMAACYNSTEPELDLYGNILSIYEKSDAAGSCLLLKDQSKGISHYKEIELHTGLKHGFLYKPMNEWVLPVKQWANGLYN